MKRKLVLSIAVVFMVFFNSNALFANNPAGDTIKILLIGDSTTEGGKPVFEETIMQLLEGEDGVPPVEVINSARGGETAYSLINSGRYEEQVKSVGSADYIFLRYGINDWIHRKPFDENFPGDMKTVIASLRNDFPGAEIIVMTIIPFLKEEATRAVNAHIAKIAAEENLALFDIYPAYREGLELYGEQSMNVRFFPLSGIPEKYHTLVAPFTKYYSWKDAEYLRVYTNELDPLFGHLPGWYKDRHPNPTGYRLIARETVKYILPKLVVQ